MGAKHEQPYPFEATRILAIAVVYYSRTPEINDLPGFVSDVTGYDRGYAAMGVRDALDAHKIFRTRDTLHDTDLYTLNTDSISAGQIASETQLFPLAEGRTIGRRTLGLLVEYKNLVDTDTQRARASHNLEYLIGVIHSRIT
jgi:hypothetical protein